MINDRPMNTLLEDIRKAQQAKYNKEDSELLDYLNQANAYLTTQYNLEENN